MKIEVVKMLKLDMDENESNIIIRALQSHAEYGDNKWPGEGHKAAAMRDEILDAFQELN